MDNIELYIILILVLFIIWFIFNTKKFYKGKKRNIKHLHRFAKEGELKSQHDLGSKYRRGDIVSKNAQRAAFWYQKAALSGDKKAQNILDALLKKKD